MIDVIALIWLIGYCFFFGLALHFYRVVGEQPPWWFYPLGLVAWPFMLGLQVGKIVSTFIEIGTLLVEEEDES